MVFNCPLQVLSDVAKPFVSRNAFQAQQTPSAAAVRLGELRAYVEEQLPEVHGKFFVKLWFPSQQGWRE